MALDLIVQHVHSQLEKVSRGEEGKGPACRGQGVAAHRPVLLEHQGTGLDITSLFSEGPSVVFGGTDL